MINYTEEQEKAVYTLDKDIILGAGAGSGKTRVLVGRYMHLLQSKKADIEEILAITFTNKAANEMQDRIREEIIKKKDIADREAKKYWNNLLFKLNNASINTFHSFTANILRENPVMGCVDPDFTVMDEEQTDRILTEVIDSVIEEGLSAEDSSIITLAEEYGLYHLSEIFQQLFHTMQKTSLTTKKVIKRSYQYLERQQDVFQNYKKDLIQAGDELVTVFDLEGASGKTEEKMKLFKRSWPEIKKAILEISGVDDKENLAVVETIDNIIKGRLASTVRDTAVILRDLIRDKRWTALLMLERAQEIIAPLGQVIQEVENRYSQRKYEMAALDFNDLEIKLMHLFKENPEFLASIREGIKYIMVDEFQDNSPRQEKLIRLLSGSEKINLFLVGDPKQSIYRFRGADVSVFKKQQQDILDKGGLNLKLTKNFRSSATILSFANFIFSRLLGNENEDINYDMITAERGAGCNNVELLLLDRNELEDKDYRELEGRQLASRIKEMVENSEIEITEEDKVKRPLGYGDIALLFQSLTNVEKYEEALQAYAIPYTVINGRGFYEKQEIIDIINLLKVIDNQDRIIALAGLLRSPFCGINDQILYRLCQGKGLWHNLINIQTEAVNLNIDNKQVIKQLNSFKNVILESINYKDSLSPVDLINDIIEKTNYRYNLQGGAYYQQQWANIDKLLNIIDNYYQRDYASSREIIDFLEEKREKYSREGLPSLEQEESNLVQLMTIHQAKGLEFPVVIVPDCQRRIINYGNKPSVLLDKEQGLGIRVNYKFRGKNSHPSPLYLDIDNREREAEYSESKRLFYVAVTRARDYLILSGSVKKKLQCSQPDKGKNWLEWVAWAFERDLIEAGMEESVTGFEDEKNSGNLLINLITEHKEEPVSAYEDEVAVIQEEISSITDWDNQKEWYQLFPQTAPAKSKESTGQKVISVTAMMVYLDCPYKYYLKYDKGIPEIFAGIGQDIKVDDLKGGLSKNGSEIGLSPAEKGTIIHRMCELSSTRQFKEDNIIDITAQEMDIVSDKIYNNKDDLLNKMHLFQQRQMKRENNIDTIIKNKSWEQEFLIKLENFCLGGKMDLLLELDDKGGLIIDLKTNNITKQEVADTAEYYRPQLEAYALAAYKIWGISPVTTILDFIIPGLEWEVNFTETDLIKLEEKASSIGNNILSERYQVGDKSACSNCNYSDICS